jgi:hypothetical protein
VSVEQDRGVQVRSTDPKVQVPGTSTSTLCNGGPQRRLAPTVIQLFPLKRREEGNTASASTCNRNEAKFVRGNVTTKLHRSAPLWTNFA